MSPNQMKNSYQASDIKVLEGLEPVRKRPGMYIGSTDARGLHHLTKEILDNAVDEAIVGFGKTIQLFRTAVTEEQQKLADPTTMSEEAITVVDNGRGIPTDMHPSGVSALEVVMTKLHAGGKFEETAYKASGGLHGVGSSAVNALSCYMAVVVKRKDKYHFQEYNQGVPKAKVKTITESDIIAKFPLQSKQFVTYQTGTMVLFIPDKSIFSTTAFSHKGLVEIVRDRAYLMAGLYFQLSDEIEGVNKHYYFEGGIRSLVVHLNMTRKPLHQVFYTNGDWVDENTHKQISAEIALQYSDSYSERIDSYVNVIHTVDGGAHTTGFRMGLNKVLKDYATKNNLLKEKEVFSTEDLREGLTAVVFVKMPSNDLQFESQTKAKLNNSEAQSAVYQIFKDAFETFLEENPKVGRVIIDKVMLAARARLAARAAKDAVIRKGALESTSLPGKLADCQSRIAADSEIYVVEGDSAGGCFAGDTQVALTDGRSLSFEDLIKEQQIGKQNFCYTIRRNGKIGVERIQNVRVTKQNAQVIRVTLDNGEAITCTPDHKFMLRDGSYKPAAQLTINDSLMPLNRKLSDKQEPNITIDGYEMVWDPQSESWLFTHMLADWYNRWQRIYAKADGDHCHHIDFNKLNNNPSNIVRLPKEDHLALHRVWVAKTLHTEKTFQKLKQLKQTPAFKQKMSQRMKEPATSQKLSANARSQWANPQYKKFMTQKWLAFYQANPEYQKQNHQQLLENQQEYWSSEEHRQDQAKRVTTYFKNHPEIRDVFAQKAKQQWQNPALLAWRKAKTQQQWTPDFRQKRLSTLHQTYYKKTISALKLIEAQKGILDIAAYQLYRLTTKDKSLLRFDTFCQRYFNNDLSLTFQAIENFNHRVVKIEPVKTKIDVYDLEVPHTHNFALASGIFVHNSAKQGRDRRFQAIFPLRGKILNTERARLDKIVASEELKNLVIALGAGIGETFNEGKLRYHRVILMNDADVDGEHITTLGLTFFFRHLPQIIEQGYLYIAMPPLFKVTTGGQDHYVYSEEDRDIKIDEIKKAKPDAVIGIQRYKGLGEMNPVQLWDTTMNPKTRIIKKVTIDDAKKADDIFSTLMGDDVLPRKKFIQANATMANLDV